VAVISTDLTQRKPDADCSITPAPPYVCPPPLPCIPSPKCCPPIVSVRNYIIVPSDEYERCLVISSTKCKTSAKLKNHCIELRLRKRGCCTVVAVERPYRLTPVGAVCFKWSIALKSLPPGYYEIDIFMDGKPCGLMGMHIPSCNTVLVTMEVLTETECNTASSCCPLEVNQEPVILPDILADCVDCTPPQ
jgi:hypothetical protein